MARHHAQNKPIFLFCYFEVEDNWRHISTGEHIMIVLSFIGRLTLMRQRSHNNQIHFFGQEN